MAIVSNGRSSSREVFGGGGWPSSDALWRELQVHDPSQALVSSQVKEVVITTNPNPHGGTTVPTVLYRPEDREPTADKPVLGDPP